MRFRKGCYYCPRDATKGYGSCGSALLYRFGLYNMGDAASMPHMLIPRARACEGRSDGHRTGTFSNVPEQQLLAELPAADRRVLLLVSDKYAGWALLVARVGAHCERAVSEVRHRGRATSVGRPCLWRTE